MRVWLKMFENFFSNLTEAVSRVAVFAWALFSYVTKAVGTPRKLLYVSHMRGLGWRHTAESETEVWSV